MTAWQRWLWGWVKIAQGLVLVLSAGFFTTGWDIRFVRWLRKDAD